MATPSVEPHALASINWFQVKRQQDGRITIGRVCLDTTPERARNFAACLIIASGGMKEFLREYGDLLDDRA